MADNPGGAVAYSFTCEYCEGFFSTKEDLLSHKIVCMTIQSKQEHVVAKTQRDANNVICIDLCSPEVVNLDSDFEDDATTQGSTSVAPTVSPSVAAVPLSSNSPQSNATVSASISQHTTSTAPRESPPPPVSEQDAAHERHPSEGASVATQSDMQPAPRSIDPTELTPEMTAQMSAFSTEELLQELQERNYIFRCVCGTIFRDHTMYLVHNSCHDTVNPKKCRYCQYEARDWNDFYCHLRVHKQKSANLGSQGAYYM